MQAKKSEKLLLLLRESRLAPVSGEQISSKLDLTRSAVWKEIQSLRQIGYDIEGTPHKGYRLVSVPDKLFADEIQYGLNTKWIGKRIFSYEELDSTNSAAWKLGEEGMPDGSCVFSEHQKKGRGRLGRAWSSPKGRNILLSILLRPKLEPAAVSRLTLVSALAIRQAVLEETGIALGLKWPNDLVYKDKKVCGILTELSAEADRVQFVVLGLGLNVNATASELPPVGISLREIAGKKFNRAALARGILRSMEKVVDRLKKGQAQELCEEWEEHSATTGRRVTASLIDRKIHGMATGIDKDGALWIRHDSGLQERILSGDIQHLR